MISQHNDETHSLPRSVFLHLVPGLLAGTFYFLVRKPLIAMGYPSLFALVLTIAVVIIPAELGYLLYKSKKKNSGYSFTNIIQYREPLPGWEYLVWTPIVFLAIGLIFSVLQPLEGFLQSRLFFWVPELGAGLDGSISKAKLIITYGLMIVFGVFAGPIVEEYYFRGYLLPRMRGKFAPFLHSFLFAVYHIFTPWMIVTRTVGLLPLIYVVRKKNIYVGILVHVLVNSIDAVIGIAFIVSMG